MDYIQLFDLIFNKFYDDFSHMGLSHLLAVSLSAKFACHYLHEIVSFLESDDASVAFKNYIDAAGDEAVRRLENLHSSFTEV